MQYYDEVQEVNERRKRRILAYYEYIDARTRDKMAEVVHKLTEQETESGVVPTEYCGSDRNGSTQHSKA